MHAFPRDGGARKHTSDLRLLAIIAGAGMILGSLAGAGAQDPPQQGDADPQTQEDLRTDEADRRNPRRIRRDEGRNEGPRMVAGGMPIGNQPDSLARYDRLEPLIGEWAMTGSIWRIPDAADPIDIEGSWSNTWELGGYYMRSTFTIEQRGDDYTSSGMLCYESRNDRYEAEFYNSNGTLRTFRWGNFENEEEERGNEGADSSSEQKRPGPGTLVMMSRTSADDPDAEPDSKIVFTIVSDDEFHYTGWSKDREGAWWKNYELIMKRRQSTEG